MARSSCKRALVEFLDGDDEDNERIYKFQILLPNGTNTRVTLHNPGDEMLIDEFVHAIRKEVEKTGKASNGLKRKIHWNGDVCLEDMHDHTMRKKICFSNFKTDRCHILKLHDDAGQSIDTFHNMWDLTPDTDILQELPAEYTFETAIADLIDNSLQAVWSNAPGERRLIKVTVDKQKLIVFDSGPGMDGSHENSISKWGKMGASLHRSYRRIAVGGKPPYLTPFFGMFGYGGPIASMHLGRYAIVSSKTRESKNVYSLKLSREELMKKSTDKCTWRADGGIRKPSDEELELSPHGSFTKVEICELKLGCMKTYMIQCFLKDVYFPYIQCDEELNSRKTTMPIEFQVNDTDLAEIEGGEVATANLHSCNGPAFVLQLHLTINEGHITSTSSGSMSSRQANARLKCIYFPIVEGRESIDRILEKLESDGFSRKEDFEKFSRVSVRRLGRLLPDARWRSLPFMEINLKRGDKAHLLKRCCQRVKCFIDTDAGFSPTPSKTDLAHHDLFTLALMSFGRKPCGEESATTVKIYRDKKQLNLNQLEKEYHDWMVQMHEAYDEEAECGEDEPVLVIAPCNKKKLGISTDVVRVHEVIRRKGLLWKSGQKVKILKGAVGCTKNNLYGTLEYFLLEGFQGDVGGEARIICRLLGCPDEKGCSLVVTDGTTSLDIHESQSFPISEIDKGKIQQIDDDTWNSQFEKKMEKAPSRIDILTSEQSSLLDIQGELPSTPVEAGYDPPKEIVAVVRPSNFTTSSSGKSLALDQKYIIRDELEMTIQILLIGNDNIKDGNLVFSQRIKPSSRNGIQGLYIFSLQHKKAKLFCKAGVYKFSFSVICKDLSCKKKELSVTVMPGSSIAKWSFCDKEGSLNDKQIIIRLGSIFPYLSVVCFDEYMNKTSISSLPEFSMKISTKDFILANVENMKIDLSSDKLSFEIMDAIIECGNLDIIRPGYKAALGMYSMKGQLIAEVPCIVLPGPLYSIEMKCRPDVEDDLVPGAVIKELELEMLDAYGNHIEEGVEVAIQVEGLCYQDCMGVNRKVNDEGFINLSGLLKVSAGYGSRARVYVCMGERMIFEKVLWAVKRELKVVSKVPCYCAAGSYLQNVVFEIYDSNGVIDKTIHGKHHTLTITSSSSIIDNTIQYTFQNGRCIVPSILVPENQEELFTFLASLTQHPEVCVNIEIHVTQAPKSGLDVISEPQALNFQPGWSDDGMLSPPYSSQCSPSKMNLLVETIMDDIKILDAEAEEAGLQVRVHEEELGKLTNKKNQIAKEVCFLEGKMEPQNLMNSETLNFSKCQIIKQIEGKANTAASVLCNLSKAIQNSSEPKNDFMQDVVGLVALLGTVSDSKLSSIFAEYLGEDLMLALVCKSYETASSLENYGDNGKVIRDSALHEVAAALGITINRRFTVICLEEIRPYRGATSIFDPQRKLKLPNPLLPSRKVPGGFLGYAVNMVNLDEHHLNTKTAAGYGLRETLFYGLLGETQVYETREQMRQAKACIKHGAISLDGGIMKENGIVSLGDHEPEVKFPIDVPQAQIEIIEQIEDRKALLIATSEDIKRETEAHSRALAKFNRKKEKCKNFLEKKSSSIGSLLPNSPVVGKLFR